MLPGKKYTPADLLGILRRRKWLILVPGIVGVAAAVFAVSRVPRLYRSESLIMVVPQRIPQSYVTPTDTTRIQDRLASIGEQIRSRSRLERLIVEMNLYAEQRARGIMEDVVKRMGDDIEVDVDKRGESFRVSYTSIDPKVAQKITERLASWYIEENLRDRENLAASTNQFLESELEDARQRLLVQEKKIEEYRRRYSGQLPSQLEANLRSMQNAQVRLQAVSDDINRARERRLLLERQLSEARTVAVPASQGDEDGQGAGNLLTATQQLERARDARERLKLRLTANHPDVRSLERTIGELQVKAAAEASRPADAPVSALSPAEVVRHQRITELEAEIGAIDRQIGSGQAQQDGLNQTLTELQGKIDAVPARESELVELTRDYGTIRDTYTSLLRKREESQLAANLERRQIGVQFRVLDPASLPVRPANLKTHLAVFGGTAFSGLLLGVLAIALLEYRDSSFKTEQEVATVLSLPVLALVPVMRSDPQASQGGRKRRWFRQARAATFLLLTMTAIGAAAGSVFGRLQF